MRNFLLHPNGNVYVGDNLFDRIYEVNPVSGKYTVYKVPHPEEARLGGILGNRFTVCNGKRLERVRRMGESIVFI